MSDLKYVIKDETRKRCKVTKVDNDIMRRYAKISLEQFHLLYEAEKIGFCIYVRIGDELIEYIKPSELSRELLDHLWMASLKPGTEISVCIPKKDVAQFHQLLDSIREAKIRKLIEKDPQLDPKTLLVFGNLSGASQMIVQGGINSELAMKVSASASYMVANLMNNELAMGTLTRMITNDPTLYDHSAAVAMFAGIMGSQHLKKPMNEHDLSLVTQCGLYHDTGKSCIPACVLNKPGAFNESEWAIMKTHTTMGYEELVNAINRGAPIDDIVPRIALEHHERMNGKGYPHGRKGRLEEDPANGIHLFTRIVSIADAYSALLMKRVYKPALTSQKAIELMSLNAEADFDMDIFKSFVGGLNQSINKLASQKDKGKIYRKDSDETIVQQIQKGSHHPQKKAS
jgi:HD-GYP domain-containing protein (c-di-GMP phosphodiesterase class II)